MPTHGAKEVGLLTKGGFHFARCSKTVISSHSKRDEHAVPTFCASLSSGKPILVKVKVMTSHLRTDKD